MPLSVALPGLKTQITDAFMEAARSGSVAGADPDAIAITLGQNIGAAVDAYVTAAQINWPSGVGNTAAPLAPNPALATEPGLI